MKGHVYRPDPTEARPAFWWVPTATLRRALRFVFRPWLEAPALPALPAPASPTSPQTPIGYDPSRAIERNVPRDDRWSPFQRRPYSSVPWEIEWEPVTICPALLAYESTDYDRPLCTKTGCACRFGKKPKA